MTKEGSVAPKERINIKYVPATGDQQAEIELPMKMVVLGDFKGESDDTPLEERRPISVDKNNFSQVLAEAELSRKFTVKDQLSGDDDAELAIDLEFKSLSDFEPGAVAKSVPETAKLLQLRDALVALKGPMGNMPAFRKSLQKLLNDEEAREKLLAELSTVAEQDDAAASAAAQSEPENDDA